MKITVATGVRSRLRSPGSTVVLLVSSPDIELVTTALEVAVNEWSAHAVVAVASDEDGDELDLPKNWSVVPMREQAILIIDLGDAKRSLVPSLLEYVESSLVESGADAVVDVPREPRLDLDDVHTLPTLVHSFRSTVWHNGEISPRCVDEIVEWLKAPELDLHAWYAAAAVACDFQQVPSLLNLAHEQRRTFSACGSRDGHVQVGLTFQPGTLRLWGVPANDQPGTLDSMLDRLIAIGSRAAVDVDLSFAFIAQSFGTIWRHSPDPISSPDRLAPTLASELCDVTIPDVQPWLVLGPAHVAQLTETARDRLTSIADDRWLLDSRPATRWRPDTPEFAGLLQSGRDLLQPLIPSEQTARMMLVERFEQERDERHRTQ